MAYDYSPSRPGPIGPYPWVQKVVAQAVTQVASGKIQIGVPAYGRDWKVSTSGTCPTLAPAGVTSAQSSSFFSSLSWANGRYAYTSGGAASYIGGLFSAGTPGISFAQRPVATWDATQKESTFPYRVTFAGRTQPATVSTTAVGGVLGGTTDPRRRTGRDHRRSHGGRHRHRGRRHGDLRLRQLGHTEPPQHRVGHRSGDLHLDRDDAGHRQHR